MNNELEIMPVGMGVLVQPYAENPYLNDKTGILLSPDGDFINPDSGLKDKLEEHVICGKVLEVGHKVEYVKEGDEVFFDVRTCRPIPFMNKGFLLTHEQGILCVLNNGLKDRMRHGG